MSLTFRKCINLDQFEIKKADQNKESVFLQKMNDNHDNKRNNDNQNQFLFKIDSILNVMDNFME